MSWLDKLSDFRRGFLTGVWSTVDHKHLYWKTDPRVTESQQAICALLEFVGQPVTRDELLDLAFHGPLYSIEKGEVPVDVHTQFLRVYRQSGMQAALEAVGWRGQGEDIGNNLGRLCRELTHLGHVESTRGRKGKTRLKRMT